MISGANSGADERGTRSSDMTLEATTKRRPFEPSLLVSSAADTLLTSGETHFGIFTCDKNIWFQLKSTALSTSVRIIRTKHGIQIRNGV